MSGRAKDIRTELDHYLTTEMDAKNSDYYKAYQWNRDHSNTKFDNTSDMIGAYYKANGIKKDVPLTGKAQKKKEVLDVLEGQGTGVTKMTNKQIAATTGQSESSVKRNMDSLEKDGKISRDKETVKGKDDKLRYERDTTVKGQEQRIFSRKQQREQADPDNHRVSTKDGEITLERKIDGKWERSMSQKEFTSEDQAKDFAAVNVAQAKKSLGVPLSGLEKSRLNVNRLASGKLPEGQSRKELNAATKKAGFNTAGPIAKAPKKATSDTNSKVDTRSDSPYDRPPGDPNNTPGQDKQSRGQRVGFDPTTKKYVSLKDGDTKLIGGKTFIFNGKTRRWNVKP